MSECLFTYIFGICVPKHECNQTDFWPKMPIRLPPLTLTLTLLLSQSVAIVLFFFFLPPDIFDTDRSGSINFSEFEGLYRYIKVSQTNFFSSIVSLELWLMDFPMNSRAIPHIPNHPTIPPSQPPQDWHAIFNRFDRDQSGTIDRRELEQALKSFGFPLPGDLVKKLEKRFGELYLGE